MSLWNENRGPFPEAMKLTAARTKHAKARLSEEPDLEVWKAAIQRVTRSAFCRGEIGDRGWRADFDWLLRPETLIRIREGKYDDAPSAPVRGGNLLRNANDENLRFEWERAEAEQAAVEGRAPRPFPERSR